MLQLTVNTRSSGLFVSAQNEANNFGLLPTDIHPQTHTHMDRQTDRRMKKRVKLKRCGGSSRSRRKDVEQRTRSGVVSAFRPLLAVAAATRSLS